ncbi:MAG TPA: tetratricopeptide repeat protein, partial [bacterium]|nr:tetratricopeptide repeat protein [bacterium]
MPAEELNKEGQDLYRQGDLAGACALFRQAVEAGPRHFPSRLNLGIALFKNGLLDESVRHCLKAVELNPLHPQAHFHLANAYFAKNWWEE